MVAWLCAAIQSCTMLPTPAGSGSCGKSPFWDSVTVKDPQCCPREQTQSFQQVVVKNQSIEVFTKRINITGLQISSGAICDSAKNWTKWSFEAPFNLCCCIIL